MINLTINNIPVEVPEGATLLAAAKQAGIKIPTLCHVEGLQTIGACRVCVVEVEGARNLCASCAMPAAAGMKVFTNTSRVRNARRTVVELLLSEHNGECQTCDRSEDCELQALAAELGIREIAYTRRADPQAGRYLDARPAPRHGQVHQVPPLRERLRRGPARRRPVPAEPRFRDGHRPRLQPRPVERDLRAVRAVRGRVPRGGDHRARSDRRGLDGPGKPRQARRGADRPGHSRRPGRVFRLSAGHAGDRQDGGGPAAAGLPRRLRYELCRRPDDPGRGHGTAHPAQSRAAPPALRERGRG